MGPARWVNEWCLTGHSKKALVEEERQGAWSGWAAWRVGLILKGNICHEVKAAGSNKRV
jgi:hypothetical protein